MTRSNPTANPLRPHANSPLPALLQALRALYPPQCVVHVGIGQGLGELVAWRHWTELPSAVLIDADPHRLAWARQGQAPTWRVLHTTVAATDGQHPYYRASHPQEDGLLPPEELKPWWPQISTLATESRHAQTLDQLVPLDGADPGTATAPGHWLLLDCLPAARLLRGASALLAHTQVVCARTGQPPTASASALADTGHQALVDLLAPQGFVLLGQTETHHPALGYTLMARQPATLVAQNALPTGVPAHATPATSQLQAENDALHQRLALLQDELLRAEGQINLIKDLMLRDQEL